MPGIIGRQAGAVEQIAGVLMRGTHPAFLIRPPHRAAVGYLVLCFRNNVPMASGCIIDFVPPGVDDWLAIDVADEGHQAFPEFVFGGDADVAQH